MKKLYKNFLRFLCNIPAKTENVKTNFFECYAILKKRKLYRNIKWTKEQQKEFNEFWKLSYGKKISNRWHKLYQSMNGVYNIEYIPERLFTTKIESKLNDFHYCRVLSDKSLLGVLFNDRIPNVRTPKTYIANSFGVFYNSERKIISENEAKHILHDIGAAVIKPTIDSSSGNNIKLLDLHSGINIKDQTSVRELFCQYNTNYVIQERIIPHAELKAIYPDAINTFRVITYILDSSVHVAPIALRLGTNGNVVDNIHSGGMSVAVHDDGTLNDVAYQLGYGDKKNTFTSHPNTGVLFKNVKFSFVDKIISTAKELHGYFSNVGVISWDLTVDNNADIVIIEVNLKGQGVWLPQIISGKSLFEQNTRSFLTKIAKNRLT